MRSFPFPKSFPDPEEENFLRLVLCDDAEFSARWADWKASTVFESMDYAMMRLLPLVYLRMEKLGLRDELFGRIKGAYKTAWVKNQRLLFATREIASACADAGIPLVILKGIPLLLAVYKNAGARFMGDADLLIHPDDAPAAVALLLGNGWQYAKPHAPEVHNPSPGLYHTVKSTSFVNGLGIEIDVHWNVFALDYHARLADMLLCRKLPSIAFRDAYWNDTLTLPIEGMSARRLSNEDLLIHIVAHGSEGNAHRTLRWAVDAIRTIEAVPIDWDKVLERAERFGFAFELSLAFRYLAETFNADIPKSFLEKIVSIRQDRKTVRDYYRFANVTHDERFKTLGNFPIVWYAYWKYEPQKLFFRKLGGLVPYLRKSWGLGESKSTYAFLKQKIHLRRKHDDVLPTVTAIRNTVVFGSGRAIAALASFAAVTVLGKYVARDVVGSYNYLVAALSIVSIATLPGMNNALTRAVAKGYEGSLWPMMRRKLKWGLLGTLACALMGTFFLLRGEASLAYSFFIAAPFVPVTDTFSNFAMSYWQGKHRFDKSMYATVVYYVGLAALSIPVFLLFKTLPMITLGVMIAQTVMGLVVYLNLRKQPKGPHDEESLAFGMHLSVMQAVKIVANSIDRIAVWTIFGPVASAVYSFAISPVQKAWQIIPISTVSLPNLSTHSFTATVKGKIMRKMLLLFLVTIPVTAFAIVFAPKLYHLFFPLYPESVPYFRLLILPLAFAPSLLLKSALTAFKKTRMLYLSTIAVPLCKIALMGILVFPFGVTGLVVGVMISSLADFFVTLFLFIGTKADIE